MEALATTYVPQLCSFLGLINYYNKFLPQASSILAQLYKLLEKQQQWIWGAEQAKVFHAAKEQLTSTKCLVLYRPPEAIGGFW